MRYIVSGNDDASKASISKLANTSNVRVIVKSLEVMEDGRNPEIINEKVVLAVFEMTNTFVHNPEVSERVQKALTYADGRELFQRSMRTFSANNRIQELGKDILKKCVEWFEKADEKSLQMHVEAHTAIYRARCKARSKPIEQLDELRERAKKEHEEAMQ